MTTLTKFGQTVRLSVYDSNSKLILDTSGLRVDFHVSIQATWNAAKFTIYNLAPETIKQLSKGKGYIRLFTQLHDMPTQELNYDFVINNVFSVKQVPNSVTELYCLDRSKVIFGDKQVQMQVTNPTLKRYCEALSKAAKADITFKYTDFPVNVLNYSPPSPKAVWSGTVLGALTKLGRQYSFTVNAEAGNVINLIFQPKDDNQKQSGQDKRPSYVLKTENMRSNPRIGIAKILIESNLDLSIRNGTILDTSKLITATTAEGFQTAATLANQVQAAVEGNARYVTLTVEHKGSNYTNQWVTTAMAYKPVKGTKMDDPDCPKG